MQDDSPWVRWGGAHRTQGVASGTLLPRVKALCPMPGGVVWVSRRRQSDSEANPPGPAGVGHPASVTATGYVLKRSWPEFMQTSP